jgi:PAS domain S-box-containing protein
VAKEERKKAAERFKSRMRDENISPDTELLLRCRDGAVKYVEARSAIINYAGKSANLSIVRDITENRQIREQLERYHGHLESFLEEQTIDLRETQGNLAKAQAISHLGSWELELKTGRIRCSEEMYRILGREPDEFDGTISSIIKNSIHQDDQADFRKMIRTATTKKRIGPMEFRIVLPEGAVREIWTDGELLHGSRHRAAKLVGVMHDITERKQSENQIKESLKEKEMLLREVHHRSKNNMQVIISLLNLQGNDISDKSMLKLLNESKNRIRSMALVHEKLYQAKNLSHVNISEYVDTLVKELFISYGVDKQRINYSLEIEELLIDITRVVPCGLIINELVCNSLEHAFKGQKKGRITITMAFESDKKNIKLTVSDNGTGIPKELDIKKSRTLGLRLVHILVTNQLRGGIKLVREKGARYEIHFPGENGN